MGYTSDHKLDEMFPQEPMEQARRRTVKRVGDKLLEEVKHRTPVAHKPAAAPEAEWLKSRGRVPGTLKESWYLLHEDGGVEVRTDDPVAPHVEWDTVPHLITAKKADVLRWWDSVSIRFKYQVHHPGTSGVHMMRDALAEVEATWSVIGDEEMEAWAREYRPGGGAVQRVAA